MVLLFLSINYLHTNSIFDSVPLVTRLEYKDYLKSEHWTFLRTKVALRDLMCVLCPKDKTKRTRDIHHLNYKEIYDVTVEDLIGVCRRHHKLIHKLTKKGEVFTLDELKAVLVERKDSCGARKPARQTIKGNRSYLKS